MFGKLEIITIGLERFEDDNVTPKTRIRVDYLARIFIIGLLHGTVGSSNKNCQDIVVTRNNLECKKGYSLFIQYFL